MPSAGLDAAARRPPSQSNIWSRIGRTLSALCYGQSNRRVRIYLSFSLNYLFGIALFVSVACAFYISPVHYLMDGQFSLLMDEALIHEWTPNMIHYQVPRECAARIESSSDLDSVQ
jgi:hypothetical protein